jgi:hypothetical protein
MNKYVALFFLISGLLCAIAIPATANIPTDRFTFILQMYAEVLSVGIAIFGYASCKKPQIPKLGVQIIP